MTLKLFPWNTSGLFVRIWYGICLFFFVGLFTYFIWDECCYVIVKIWGCEKGSRVPNFWKHKFHRQILLRRLLSDLCLWCVIFMYILVILFKVKVHLTFFFLGKHMFQVLKSSDLIWHWVLYLYIVQPLCTQPFLK